MYLERYTNVCFKCSLSLLGNKAFLLRTAGKAEKQASDKATWVSKIEEKGLVFSNALHPRPSLALLLVVASSLLLPPRMATEAQTKVGSVAFQIGVERVGRLSIREKLLWSGLLLRRKRARVSVRIRCPIDGSSPSIK